MSESLSINEFVRKWRVAELKERSSAQEHFLDLCRVLGEASPATADPTGESYCFERGATKASGGDGWADVWKRGHFGWEYKGKRKNLDAAFGQLQQYALALENPPLLVVCDTDRVIVRTNWTNTVSAKYDFDLDDLRDPRNLRVLKWVMSDPERLRPNKTREDLTKEAAAGFATLAQRLRDRGHDPAASAHFINRLVFCLFAENAELLPNKMFSRMLAAARAKPADFTMLAGTLFRAMKDGGPIGFERVEWFNGGLFDTDDALPLTAEDIALCIRAAALGWGEIDPTIFGTLFVRGLDPNDRSKTGAEYTDRDKIMMILEPVVTRPLLREWETVRAGIEALIAPAQQRAEEAIAAASGYPELVQDIREIEGHLATRPQLELFGELRQQRRVRAVDTVRQSLRAADRALTDARDKGRAAFDAFLARLRNFRVLDPACGSGNFLYLALVELKNIERRVSIEGESLGFPPSFPEIGPRALLGLEINPYAAELARVCVWIGEIQWMRRNAFDIGRPILKPLDTIECRNAIINDDGTASVWPHADVVVGNPPYLGAKLLKRRLGSAQAEAMRRLYDGRLPGFTDLVCYWFENARALIEQGALARAGLVATNSIRKNTNLPVMSRIAATTTIFEAWSEQKWTVDGAAVDVSLICFGDSGEQAATLDGKPVSLINPDLTSGLNLTLARPLAENKNGAFLGIQKSGPFDVPGSVARAWMAEPANPNGRGNSEVLKPYWNGDDLTGRPRDMWFIDLPNGLSEGEAALFASPFQHIATTPDEDGLCVKELRKASGSDGTHYPWWEPWRPRPAMRARIQRLRRYIVTAETAEYRVFAWLAYPVLPDKNLIVIPREDDLMFGLLQSRFHQAWALRKGSDLQDRPRYTHTTTFATYPFPDGMTPDRPVPEARALPASPAIEAAAGRLNELRTGWLYPADLIEQVPETVPGFPDRLVPRDARAERELSRRTMTALYNERPRWLQEAHRALDQAVAAAYGWPADIGIDEALRRLLDLNLSRSG